MNIAIILNGISRKKAFFYRNLFPPLEKNFNITVFETQHAQHAIELATAISNERFDCVLAAGGDGTLNQVLNGLMKSKEALTKLPSLGIIPLGTGNDFAKMCGIKAEPLSLVKLLAKNAMATDIGRISCFNEHGQAVTSYFINVCSIGMGPEVVKRLLKSDRSLGPLLTYFKAITETFFTHRPQEIAAKTVHWEWRGKARVLAVANGKSFGNSMFIAPDALPDDNLFSTFIAGDLSLLTFLFYLQQVKGKKKIRDLKIMYNQCTSIEITSPAPGAVEAEGEWMGWLPMKIEILPKQINFLRDAP